MIAGVSERRRAFVLVVLSFLLFTSYSLATPLFEASDELWHYPFVQRLATGGGLPVQRPGQTDAEAPWRQEGSQPPLYYGIAALFSAPFDSSNWPELRRLNPHADMGVPTRDGNNNAILLAPADAFPWTRAALAVRAARFASILLSTATVVFAYLAASEVFREASSARRLMVMIFVACVPMFAYISGSINNDNAAVTFSSAGLWWALRLIRLGKWDARSGAVAGVMTGLAALSKVSGLGLAGLFAAAGIAGMWPASGSLAGRIRGLAKSIPRLLVFGASLAAVAALVAGWWYARNLALYGGDVLGWNAFLDAVGRRSSPASPAQLWSEREGFFWAFWGVFGTLNVIMPPWIYDVLAGAPVIALVGILSSALSRARLSVTAARQAFAMAAFTAIVFVALLRWTTLTPASQGRLMFPCIAAIGIAFVYGTSRINRKVLYGAMSALTALAMAMPAAVLIPAYAKPEPVWTSRLPNPVQATFDGVIELVEAATEASVEPGGEITLRLNWRVVAPPPINYSVFVHLVDDDDVVIAQRDMYPGQGSLATAELAVGRLWSDRYTLRVSRLERAPRAARWMVGLYDNATGARAALTGAPGAFDAARFGSAQVNAGPDASPILRYENGLVLDNYDILPSSIAPGEAFQVALAWSAARSLEEPFVVSVQLLDVRDGKVAQSDQSPAGRNSVPWQPGERRPETRTLATQPDAPPGVYRLMLVVYRPGTFGRFGAFDRSGQFAGDQIELTKVRVR